MPERDDHKKVSSRRAGLLDHVARALAMAERRFRRADQLDYFFSENLSNEVTSPMHLPEMLLSLETSPQLAMTPTMNVCFWPEADMS